MNILLTVSLLSQFPSEMASREAVSTSSKSAYYVRIMYILLSCVLSDGA